MPQSTEALSKYLSARPRAVIQITNGECGFYAEFIDVDDRGAQATLKGFGLTPALALLDLRIAIKSRTEPHFNTKRAGDFQ